MSVVAFRDYALYTEKVWLKLVWKEGQFTPQTCSFSPVSPVALQLGDRNITPTTPCTSATCRGSWDEIGLYWRPLYLGHRINFSSVIPLALKRGNWKVSPSNPSTCHRSSGSFVEIGPQWETHYSWHLKSFFPYLPSHCNRVTETSDLALCLHVLYTQEVWSKSTCKEGHFTRENNFYSVSTHVLQRGDRNVNPSTTTTFAIYTGSLVEITL
jgi:hypothetical protein